MFKMMVWIRSNMTNEVLTKVDGDQLEKIKWRLEGGSNISSNKNRRCFNKRL